MRRPLIVALALGAACACTSGAGRATAGETTAASGGALEQRLDAALSAPSLRGAKIGALVVAREGGSVLYARDADRPLVPASNQKILTALAALSVFGPSYAFETEVLADAEPDADGAVDVLVVRGGGDPALTSEQLWRLAADLRRLGLRRVRKAVWLDDGAFDRERWHPSWGETSARAYHAPVGALNVNYGAFAVTVTPGPRPGAPVRVVVDPPVAYLPVESRAVTGAPGSARSLRVDRVEAGERERVVVEGSMPAGAEPVTAYRSVLDPARYAGAVLRMQLEAQGISVPGTWRVGTDESASVSLHVFEGRPLADVVQLFMKFSNNAMGESLVKAIGARASGAPGSWPEGLGAVRAELARIGLDMDGVVMVDGSGLSYDNRVSPRRLVAALALGAASFRFGPELVAALPIGAADGTLEKRAAGAGAAVRAKTGLLTRVTGLSGLARLPDGRDAVFSVLVNGFRGGAEGAMRAVDAFVAELTRGGAGLE